MTPYDYLYNLGESIWNDGDLCESCSALQIIKTPDPGGNQRVGGMAPVLIEERHCVVIGEDCLYTKCVRLSDVFNSNLKKERS